MIYNQNNRLVKDSTKFFIGNQDTACLEMFDWVSPSVFVNSAIRWLDMNGKFGGRNKGICIQEFLFGHSDAVPLEDIVVVLLFVI